MASVGLFLILLSSLDAGAERFARLAAEFAAARGFEMDISAASGNPVHGFALADVRISFDGACILSSDSVSFRPSLLSLLHGAARPRELRLSGAEFDGNAIARLSLSRVASLLRESGGANLLVEQGIVRTSARAICLSDAALRFSGGRGALSCAIGEEKFPLRAEFTLSEKELFLETLSLEAGEGSIGLSGRLLPSPELEGDVQELDAALLARIDPRFSTLSCDGLFSAGVTLEGTWEESVLGGSVRFHGGRIFDLATEEAVASFELANGRLAFDELEIRAGSALWRGTLSLSFGRPTSFDLALEGEEVPVGQFLRLFPSFPSISGSLSEISLRLTAAEDRATGRIAFRAPRLFVENAECVDVMGDGALQGDMFRLTTKGRALGGEMLTEMEMRTSGFAGFLRGKKISLASAAALFPELAELHISGDVACDAQVEQREGKWRTKGTVRAERLSWGERSLEALSLSFRRDDETFFLERASVQVGTSRFSARGTLRRTNAGLLLDLEGRVSRLPLSALPLFLLPEGRGRFDGTWSLSGRESDAEGEIALGTNTISFGEISCRGVRAAGRLSLHGGAFGASELSVDVAALEVSSRTLAENLSVRTELGDDVVRILEGGGRLASGALSFSGWMTPRDVELAAEVESVDLSRLGAFTGIPLGGNASAALSLVGQASDPSFSFTASAPAFSMGGVSLGRSSLRAAGRTSAFSFDGRLAPSGGGALSLHGTLRPGGQRSLMLSLQGKRLDPAMFAPLVGSPAVSTLGGRASVSIAYEGTGTGENGSGSVKIEGVEVVGSPLGFLLPFEVDRGVADVRKGEGTIGAAGAALRGRLDLRALDWNAALEIAGGDLGDLVVGKGAHAAGRFDLVLRGEGNIGKRTMNGVGSVHVRGGELLLPPLPESLRFRTGSLFFRIDGDLLSILPGSRIEAPGGDPLYRYLAAEGRIGPARALSLYVYGNVDGRSLHLFARDHADFSRLLAGIVPLESGFRDVGFLLEGALGDVHVGMSPSPRQ